MFFFKKPAPTGLSIADAVQRAKNGDLVLVDVREHEEVAATGKAKGALHVPLMRMRDMADPRHPDYNAAFRNDACIAVYCASGGRSHSAVQMMRKLGYADVHNIGGFGHWVQAGGAIDAH
ncbi:MAG: rhodanese-like domain-containing protein [Shimia thalassica]|uniref:rhodanese-like domain-containing protein n=1 Tax=Shimia thalassica TaxID=1715693 RepID=UPI0032977F16